MSRWRWYDGPPKRGTVAWLERNGYVRSYGIWTDSIVGRVLTYGISDKETHTMSVEERAAWIARVWKARQALVRELFGGVFKSRKLREHVTREVWLPGHVHDAIQFVCRHIQSFRDAEWAKYNDESREGRNYVMRPPPITERQATHAGVHAYSIGPDFLRALEAAWEVGSWRALKAVIDGSLHEPDPNADAGFDPDAV